MFKRYFITLLLMAAAIGVLYSQYQTYTDNPWTRDGQVRAYVIQVTPRVTGQIVKVNVIDNSHVQKGDVLFEIDASLYQTSLQKAVATEKQSQALVRKAQNESSRAIELEKLTPGAQSVLTLNNLQNAVETAQANLLMAKAQVAEAKLNLAYTKITAPTDGYITNLNYRVGSQVVANSPVVALIDENSFWIDGFFKETDLKDVAIDNKAQVTLMMHDQVTLEGKVQSIGYGISKTDGSTGNSLLPNVNPNFEWIRLAQRIPVKIKLDKLPEDIQLRVGMTASVKILKH
ncbi:HlyD family secretion protein [Pseudomonadota bacterium]|uniref:HlyD family secretion protein n=1 Tax=unclassified Shewanella TaxID=196818 RepID=UPI000C822BCD|nr:MULTISPECIES: HlyD family secretion protein [unclassified Shewanella]MDO6638408.1 HlyD family secretion protein [Shewanella sp. 5_MG-2023]MDO6677416.1 HlyD family secretion protein [Shewanella sp. 4_MG-2023]MDO6774230.1 HlyD family secretion protein [Shewanella sp. 3_MG-2023]PMH87353.1 efflux transporter periplasmic adaptor subunit [Shewanella sp. 10N.286.48.B5]PMI00467.1 efflux transporter periplasmic adaptor subunit [Shewanella sp. 10N.286.48.A6]